MPAGRSLLELLVAGASPEELDEYAEARVDGLDEQAAAELREEHALALRVQEQMARQRSREAELSALNETARDLSEIRDLDAILGARGCCSART